MSPSQGCEPSSSPPTSQPSSTMRPGSALVTTTSLTATCGPSERLAASVQSSTVLYSPAKTRRSASSSWSPSALVRKPMRPKFTPNTGVAAPRVALSARSIVPSPPSATTRSGDPSPSEVSSTPASAARFWTRVFASPIRSGRPWVKSAAQVTVSGMLGGAEVEEELTISLRPGEARVGDPFDPRSPIGRLRGNLIDHALVKLGVADDPTLADLLAPCLELRLDEDQSPPVGRRAGERRWQRLSERDEGDVAGDESRAERQLRAVQVAHVHALHDRDARVLAELRVELAVTDVERAHARRARLEKTVGEPAGRGSDVEAILLLDLDGEGRERVGELLSSARDEARAGLDLDFRRLVHLFAGLCMAGHLSGEDKRLRLRARLGEAALDHEDIEPLLGHVESVTPVLRRNRHGSGAAVANRGDELGQDGRVRRQFGQPLVHPRPRRVSELSRALEAVQGDVSDLASGLILSGCLPELGSSARRVEDVVHDLEEQAELLPECRPRGPLVGWQAHDRDCAGDRGA